MIPADLSNRLRLVLPDQPTPPQPVPAAQKLTDVLSNLVAGQRVMAQILAALPNGTYRAVINQRDITLALPFSAKAGDSIELEASESDGKLTLAVVSGKTSGESAGSNNESASVSTTLSSTGRLISTLIGGVGGEGEKAAAAPLNDNLPLTKNFPASGAELAPVLKDALNKSGIFYEAHQARWIAGELPTETLLQEPQGKISRQAVAASNPPALPIAQSTNGNAAVSTSNSSGDSPAITAAHGQTETRSSQAPLAGSPVPKEIAPIVQQQLDGLASQNYVWQGQVWPGQNMQWEISSDPEGSASNDTEGNARWQTRLKISLPTLGNIDATLHISSAGNIDIKVNTATETGNASLSAATDGLKKQMEAAGLNLRQILVQHANPEE